MEDTVVDHPGVKIVQVDTVWEMVVVKILERPGIWIGTTQVPEGFAGEVTVLVQADLLGGKEVEDVVHENEGHQAEKQHRKKNGIYVKGSSHLRTGNK